MESIRRNRSWFLYCPLLQLNVCHCLWFRMVHHEANLQLSKGHRTNNRNLATRGITEKTDEEVQAIIDEVVSNGPGAIPSDIKAVPSIKGAKSGYKGVLKHILAGAVVLIILIQFVLDMEYLESTLSNINRYATA